MNKLKRYIALFLAAILVIQINCYAKNTADNRNPKNGPFVLMYDSNARFVERIKEIPEMADADMASDIDNSAAEGRVSNSHNSNDKHQVKKIDRTVRDQILVYAADGDIDGIERLDIPDNIMSQVKRINDDVRQNRFIVKYKDDNSADLSAFISKDHGTKGEVSQNERSGKMGLLVLDEKVNPKELANTLSASGAAKEIEYIQPDFQMEYASGDGSLSLEIGDDSGTDSADSSAVSEPDSPSAESSKDASSEPSEDTTDTPAGTDTEEPSVVPIEEPTEEPSTEVTEEPTEEPTGDVTAEPTATADETAENMPVIVAVIDTGIDIMHPGLVDAIWSNAGEIPDDGIDNDGNGYVDDVNGWSFSDNSSILYDASHPLQSAHGTHIAGIIASKTADYDVKIMPLKVFGGGGAYTSDIINALHYAEANGARIVNCSFGSTENNTALKEAIQSSGMLFVSAVGNARSNLETAPVYPACFGLDNDISVTSTNADGGLSYYSNYSSNLVDVAALGRDVYSTLPGGEYGKQSGTSMAAAEVSGIAAAVLSTQGELDAAGLKQRLASTSDMLSNLRTAVAGGRQIDMDNALQDIEPTAIIENNPEDDFSVLGYNPTQDELQQLYSSSGDIVQVSAGGNFTVVLKEDGTVWTWGRNEHGECGNGTETQSEALTQVIGLTNVVQITAGGMHGLAIKSDGTVWAWGCNYFGELGNGTISVNSTVPVQVSGLIDVSQVSAGYTYSMALKSDGTVWGFGFNGKGELGNGTTDYAIIPTQVSGLTGVSQISAGKNHVLAQKLDGTIWSWGANDCGKLGDGTTTNKSAPVQTYGISSAQKVAAGGEFSLALLTDGTVMAWGANYDGELGDGTYANHLTPVQITSLSGVAGISAGYYHALALESDGTVKAWGYNYYGQVGDTTTGSKGTPVNVDLLSDVTSIDAGDNYSVALKSDGTAWAWGYNYYGQLGDGTSASSIMPALVSNLTGITGISNGYRFSAAVKSDGTVWTWGSNSHGQLGNGTWVSRSTPAEASNMTGVIQVAAGKYHLLALKSDGTVWAWGNNYYGQLGFNITGESGYPIQITGLSGVVKIAAGQYHSMALKSDGTVWTWGCNTDGELGDGTAATRFNPVQVNNLTGVTNVAGGELHSMALKSDGTVWAWGNNDRGQLGDGTTTARATPVQVSGLSGVADIAAGSGHSLALLSGGTVYAWGHNGLGQLGNGSYDDSLTPVQMTNLTGITDISGGALFSTAVKSDGSVWACGDNSYNEIGGGTYIAYGDPVQVAGISSAALVSSYDFGSLALRTDGTVYSWGKDNLGQLGNTRVLYSATPIQSQTYIETLDFDESSYTVQIPASGTNTVTVRAEGNDAYGNTIETGEVAYSLANTYAGVTIDSSTGVVTVTNEASAGSVQVIATYGDYTTCTATLNIQAGGASLTFNTQSSWTYNIQLKANNITSFSGRTFTLTYDPAILQPTDLCAFTYAKEAAAGTIDQTGITITNLTSGTISFQINHNIPQGKKWTGVLDVISFTALSTGSTSLNLQ